MNLAGASTLAVMLSKTETYPKPFCWLILLLPLVPPELFRGEAGPCRRQGRRGRAETQEGHLPGWMFSTLL